MEYPFSSSKENGIGSWTTTPRSQIEGMMPCVDGKTRFPISEDPFNNFTELMNFDSYAGWCTSPPSSATDQIFPSFPLSSPIQQIPSNYPSMDGLNFTEQNTSSFPVIDSDFIGNSYGDTQYGFALNSADEDDSDSKRISASFQQNMRNYTIPRPLGRPLAEKMLRALSLFKESSGGGILAQVWVPIKHGNQIILSTCDQPYLLDQMLAGYREVSRTFTFPAEIKPGSLLGLPGRVFISKVPEWTSNIVYYNKDEYLRVQHAVNHEVRGSMAIPIFEGDPSEMSCCAVLELVTTREKPNFDSEIDSVCRSLQAVNLRSSTPPRLYPQCLSKNQRAALAEITDVLRVVCHAHSLPLALTWIPCIYTEGVSDETIRLRVRGGCTGSDSKSILCIEDTACYVNDTKMQGLVHACAEHHLEEGQGIAGKALQSNHPFFFPDVKIYDISEYPLVHHARKFGLNAAVAIRLRSTFTGDDDYILEFFLPINMKGSTEQQLLLNNLSDTTQRICRSLRTVSDAELAGKEDPKSGFQEGAVPNFLPMELSRRSSQEALFGSKLYSSDNVPLDVSDSRSSKMEADGSRVRVASGSRKQAEKRRSAAEKNVSLSVLQQYFSGSLKDAAKSIGVCPTTLKRICRQHGISRWPSRKINKVNRSLRKIQTVLDSVQGVEGGLKFDPAIGGLVAAGSIIQDFDARSNILFSNKTNSIVNPQAVTHDGENSIVKLEADDECYPGGDQVEEPGSLLTPASFDSMPWSSSENASMGTSFRKEECKSWGLNMGNLKLENTGSHFISQSSDEMGIRVHGDTAMDGEDGVVEHNQPTSSGMTDSSNGSGSMMNGSSSSSPSFGGQKHSKTKTSSDDSGSNITVKATYKEDTIRFKFDPSSGCLQLYEEVAKRFKLQIGTFQLKYLDDEEEWVMLVSDSDLQECVEILDFLGTRSVKFLVRDAPCGMGSSGSSNCFLGSAR